MSANAIPLPDTDSLWMPFTANRQFKAAPRLLVGASGMYYTTHDGRRVLDGSAGLWCVNAGHCRPEIAEAIARQSRELDYAPGFQMGHPLAFEAASRVARLIEFVDVRNIVFVYQNDLNIAAQANDQGVLFNFCQVCLPQRPIVRQFPITR